MLLARSAIGWRSLSRLVSRANLAGTKSVPRFRQALLDERALADGHVDALCREFVPHRFAERAQAVTGELRFGRPRCLSPSIGSLFRSNQMVRFRNHRYLMAKCLELEWG